jgi:hypothetical protein
MRVTSKQRFAEPALDALPMLFPFGVAVGEAVTTISVSPDAIEDAGVLSAQAVRLALPDFRSAQTETERP